MIIIIAFIITIIIILIIITIIERELSWQVPPNRRTGLRSSGQAVYNNIALHDADLLRCMGALDHGAIHVELAKPNACDESQLNSLSETLLKRISKESR